MANAQATSHTALRDSAGKPSPVGEASFLYWAPIPLLMAAMVALWVADVRVVWPLPVLYWFSHYAFVALGVVFIAIPAARRFLASGQPSVLMLGCGVLMMDIGVAAMPIGFTRSSNTAFAIFNTSVLLSALCHFGGVAITSRRRIRFRRSTTWLTATYAGGLAAIGLVIWGAFTDRMPGFFIDGQGGTVLRSLVVSTAVALFVLTAYLLWQTHRWAASRFLYWYALGLVLLATGLTGGMLIAVRNSPLQWLARFTEFLGAIYMCVAVLVSQHEGRARAIPLAAVEKAWRQNEFLADLRQQTPLSWVLRYGLAVVTIAAAFGLREALTAWVGHGLPRYIIFYPGVMVVGLLVGFGPGLAATALATLLTAYWILSPVGQLAIASPEDRLGLAIFIGMGVFMSVVTELYRRNREKVAAYDREAALREGQARLATFAEATFEGIAESEAGRIVDCNEQFARMLGYSVAELRGMAIADLIAPEDRDRAMVNILQGRESVIEHALVRRDGTRIVIEAHGRPVSQGSARRHTAVRDITERKRAEEALRESEERLRLLGDNLPTSAVYQYMHEPDGTSRFLYISAGVEQLIGVKPQDVLRDPALLHSRILPEYLAAVVEAEAVSKRELSVFGMEVQMRRTDGQVRWMHLRSRPRRLADGRVVWDGVQTDVTARKQAEQTLKELNETLEGRVTKRTAEAEHRAAQLRALAAELAQAEQRERQRLATILHDNLQQLLVGSKFHLGVLRGQLRAPRQRDLLKQVDNLLDESLDASRSLTVDLCPPILQQGTMPQVLRWLGEWFDVKHGLAVEIHADEQASPPAREVRVLLFQAVRELLFNVVKHAKVRQACVELSRAADSRINIVVSDAGEGFDPSQSSVNKHESGGFGLFNIRERLDWLGGSLEIQSAPGQGTRATLTAPIRLKAKTADVPVALEIAPASGPTTGDSHDKVRVLLADDHAVMRDGLSSLLRTQPGIEVIGQAADGQQAVDMARQLQPDVVIMDVNMPYLDGVEATRQIKARQPQVQVIGLSMFNEEGVVEAMKAAGAAEYLAKTSGPDALIAAISASVTAAG